MVAFMAQATPASIFSATPMNKEVNAKETNKTLKQTMLTKTRKIFILKSSELINFIIFFMINIFLVDTQLIF